MKSAAEIPALKRTVLATERRLILAAGSPDDLKRLSSDRSGAAGGNGSDGGHVPTEGGRS